MFCYQCQETAKNTGCDKSVGVCSKEAPVGEQQDMLFYLLQGIAHYQEQKGTHDPAVSQFIMERLFSTISRANFDGEAFARFIREALELRSQLQGQLQGQLGKAAQSASEAPDAARWVPKDANDLDEIRRKAQKVGVLSVEDEDIRSLRELLKYGLKGVSAYGEHAAVLGYHEEAVDRFLVEALSALNTLNRPLDSDALLGLVLRCGEAAVQVMALLDRANTETFGNPTPTKVSGSLVGEAPGILVTGHDLLDLKELLEQSAGSGVNIYTHSEMLIANSYPELKKFPHLKGNWGGAWYEQQLNFARFNGPVLFTTNCIVKPLDSYTGRVFTTGSTGYPGWTHIAGRSKGGQKDFSALIAMAKSLGPLEPHSGPDVTTGFSRETLLGAKDAIIDAVKAGKIKKFMAMGGCDGFHKERQYYTEFAEALPEDTLILTAGCAKYRYNRLDLGTVAGLPRVIDAGQCNDNYSLAVLALELQQTLGTESLNDLPIVFNITWYEQKAVAVLLALLHLGVKGLQIGPTLPAFLSPNVTKILVDTFGLSVKGELKQDLERMLA